MRRLLMIIIGCVINSIILSRVKLIIIIQLMIMIDMRMILNYLFKLMIIWIIFNYILLIFRLLL